ncbi:MAG: DMT family transporter [Parafilimonas sp.]|nr:DMT family transporter [Parafilimonas sp.]
MNKKLQAHTAVLLANIFFGVNYITIKSIVPLKLSAPALNVSRVVGSSVLFWLLFLIKPSAPGILKKDIPRFILCAVLGVALNQALFVKGLSFTSSIHASLLMLVTPILIIFIAAWILKEKLTALKIIGVITGVAGATLLILMKDVSHTASNIFLGDVLVILNAVSYAFYLVLVRPLMKRYSAIHVIRWVFTLSLFFMIPYGWHDSITTQWQNFTTSNWMCFAFVITGATFFAYLFNIYGVEVIGASATGSYIYTQPVFAAIIAMIFTGEAYDWLKLFAASLIFSGVYMANYKPSVS